MSLAGRIKNARSMLDATPAVERSDYGAYEPRCVMDGIYIRAMEDTADEYYSTANKAMARAEEALAAFKVRAQEFLDEVDEGEEGAAG